MTTSFLESIKQPKKSQVIYKLLLSKYMNEINSDGIITS